MESPYGPGAGVMPPLLAGRDDVRARGSELLSRTVHFGAPGRSPVILTGVRGVGKTVTLRAIVDEAAASGFVTARVTVDRHGHLPARLAAALLEATGSFHRQGGRWKRWRDRMSRLSVEVSVAGVVKIERPAGQLIDPVPVVDADPLISAVADGARLVREEGSRPGLCLALDELQEGPEDGLAAVTTLAQELVDQPLVVIGAGLPNTPERLMAAGSYAERFQYQALGPLPLYDASAALLIPANARGVSWQQDAAELVLRRAAGAPYLLQMFGDAAWRAGRPDQGGVIDMTAAESGIESATRELHGGMFRGRWNRASELERRYLSTMAQLLAADGAVGTGDVAAALGRTTTQLGYVRTRLLDKGLIQAAGWGRVAFSFPGFAEFAASADH